MNISFFKRACRISSPIFFGYIAIGIPFGLMIVNAGYPWWISLFMSATMYAGAGQYIAAGMFAAGASLPEIMITELFVNIRHIVYGLSLITKTKNTGHWKPYIIFGLTDETYALLTGTDLPEHAEPGAFFGTIALLDQLYWIAGAVIGALAYSILLHYDLAQYLSGVDFALTALFVVILIGQLQKSKDFMPPATGFITGTAAVILCRTGLVSSTNIMLVAIILGIAGIVLIRGRQFYRERNIKINNLAFAIFAGAAVALVAAIVAFGPAQSGGISPSSDAAEAAKSALTLREAVIATLVSAAIIFMERLFPFALFSRKDPPEVIRFIEKYIPSLIMAILIVYCLKDVQFACAPFGAPYLASIAVTVLLHLAVKNPMVSIFGGTILFMVLSRLL